MHDPIEAEVEGVQVRITRRASEAVFDVKFLDTPPDAPSGYTFANHLDDDAPLDREETLRGVAETIHFLRGKGQPL